MRQNRVASAERGVDGTTANYPWADLKHERSLNMVKHDPVCQESDVNAIAAWSKVKFV
jgi:hypothetical protein